MPEVLVAIPSPRNIPKFKWAVDKYLQEYDKVWFKYYPQSHDPYKKIKQYFLSKYKKKYTHLAILPDDLVVNPGVELLYNWLWANPDRYKVIMGDCLVENGLPFHAFTWNLPALEREKRVYDWCDPRKFKLKNEIIQVPHAGTPFAILSREVVEQVSFDNDLKWNEQHGNVGTSEDVVLSWDLYRLGIPLYVHTGVFFDHLKGTKEANLVNYS